MERAKKIPKGRAFKRIIYARRYANVVDDGKKKKTPNWHAGNKDRIAEEEARAK